MNRHVVS